MKKLLWLLPLLVLLPLQVEAATWASYSDPARTVQCDNFDSPNAVIYMKGSGLLNNKTYRASYFDAQGCTVSIYDGQSSATGVFISQVKPSDYPTSSPGLWTAKLERVVGGNPQLICTDTFTVTAPAIPELSVIGGIVSGLLIGLIYLRKSMSNSRKVG